MISSSSASARSHGQLHDVIIIAGATATGKSAVGLQVAVQLDGEIVSADSRAFFRGMDILTDKPSREDRERVPHHLLDVCSFSEAYDAMRFRQDADQAIRGIVYRGRTPIVVGGGTLYIAALVEGLFQGPSADPVLRSELAQKPTEQLHSMLRQVDPVSAQRIHPNDRLRVVRALEVHRKTGTAISRLQSHAVPLEYAFHGFVLDRDRDAHRQAIETRVGEMVASGLVSEVRALRDAGLVPAMQAFRTIGVPEAFALLDGEIDEATMREQLTHRTWALARRQTAWFRRLGGFRWVQVEGRSAANVAGEIVEKVPCHGSPSEMEEGR